MTRSQRTWRLLFWIAVLVIWLALVAVNVHFFLSYTKPRPGPVSPPTVVVVPAEEPTTGPIPSVVVTAGPAVPHATKTPAVYVQELPTRPPLPTPTATAVSSPEPTPTSTPDVGKAVQKG